MRTELRRLNFVSYEALERGNGRPKPTRPTARWRRTEAVPVIATRQILEDVWENLAFWVLWGSCWAGIALSIASLL